MKKEKLKKLLDTQGLARPFLSRMQLLRLPLLLLTVVGMN